MSKLKYYDGTEWQTVNGQITGDTLPIGSIIPYGSTNAPVNWLVCDGSAISRTTYADLFNIIGTSFGSGDGSTTFNLPNLKGKVPVGQDTTQTEFDTIGETGGSKYLQAHQHRGLAISDATLSSWSDSGSGNIFNMAGLFEQGVANNNKFMSGAVEGTTGNAGNLQPYQVVCYIIKAFQSSGLIANVSNTQSNSQTDVYSCDYVNNNFSKLINYSSTEVDTGIKWVDNKKIYQKTIQTTLSGTYTENDYIYTWIPSETVGNVDTMVNLEANIKGINRQLTEDNNSVSIEYLNDGRIQIGVLSILINTSSPIKITIQYTKN